MLIHSPPKFTKHSFIPPFEISEEEYNAIRSSPDYVKAVVKPEWRFFNANYTRPLLFWSVPLVLILSCFDYILATHTQIDETVLGLLWILAFHKTLQYGLSAYSLWELIQKKRKFYKMVKNITDKTGTYQLFVERFKNRNVR